MSAIETPTNVVEVLAALVAAQSKMLDPLDIPGNWTQRQRDNYGRHRQQLERLPGQIADAQQAIANIEQELQPFITALDRLKVAEASLVDDAGSLRALRLGVASGPNGQPMLSPKLRAMFVDTCATCGHEELAWIGSLDFVEDRVK